MYFSQCCYFLTRRKYRRGEDSGDYVIKYHYNLATGNDAGMPLDQRNLEDDMAAWNYARSDKSLAALYRQFRPPSTEQGSCGCSVGVSCEEGSTNPECVCGELSDCTTCMDDSQCIWKHGLCRAAPSDITEKDRNRVKLGKWPGSCKSRLQTKNNFFEYFIRMPCW